MEQPPLPIPMPLRFVVLHHTGIADEHFDFMIESTPGGSLHTWRCYQIPTEMGVTPTWRLPNHRAAYLEYEGPISGNRGRVARIISGKCAFHRRDFRTWIFVPDRSLYPKYVVGPLWAYPLDPSKPPKLTWMIEGSGDPRQADQDT